MADSNSLKALENSLNKDENLRAAFLKDPVKGLKGGGIDLSADQATSIKSQFSELGLKKLPDLAARIRISIKIGIGISTK